MKTETIKTEAWIISTIEDTDCLMIGGGNEGSDIVADIRTDHPNAEQNAHLIASAPEMLAALKGAQSALRKAMPFIKDPDDTSNIGAQLYCGEWLDEVNEAIAHAEGRELGCI
ncbi:MAG: hypothetical protein CMC15_13585 [Flavobacteriaceae bacterium]|nr:hypothetical protein [Flavobacteriaceae bacterium]